MVDLKIGDKVKYSPKFCEVIGQRDAARYRGHIVEICEQVRPDGPYRVRILWANEAEPKGALSCNIAKVRGKK